MTRYITESQATARYSNRLPVLIHVLDGNGAFELFDVWSDADTTEREQALDEATRFIDNFTFDGEKADSEQDNEFPRKGQAQLPDAVKQGCFALALFFLEEYFKKTNEPGYRAMFKQSGVVNGTITLADSSERMIVAQPRKPEQVIIPYINKWIKGSYSITRWRY